MKIINQLFLFALLALVLASCKNYSEQQESQTTGIDTLQVIDFTTVVSTESALLGEPREIVSIDDKHIAVYDHSYKKIIIFNGDGDKLDEFGNVGEGPGEWDSMSGAADLNFVSDRFFTNNQGRYLFDLYDRSGNHIRSMTYPQYLNYSHKTLLPDNKLLVVTNGRENALATLLDLNEEGKIIQKIGLPESEYSESRNYEQERVTYSNGKIPENDLNEALAVKGKDGYFLFMNALGELRYYSDEGELIMHINIPENIKRSRFDYVIRKNRELYGNLVLPLRYAQDIKIHDDLIYLFMPKPDRSATELDFRILVYNLNGELQKHYVFVDSNSEYFFYDFAMSSDKNIYLMDIMKSEISKFSPVIE